MRLSLRRYFHCPKLQYAWIIWETKWSLQGKENDQQSTRKEKVLGLLPRRNGKPLHSTFAFFLPTFYAFSKATKPTKHQPKCSLKLPAFFSFLFSNPCSFDLESIYGRIKCPAGKHAQLVSDIGVLLPILPGWRNDHMAWEERETAGAVHP